MSEMATTDRTEDVPALSQKKAASRGPRAYTTEQLRSFIREAHKEPCAALISFITFTGVTLGEALALDWDDVDLDRKQATIHQSLRLASQPRCNLWRRSIDLPTRLVALLQGLPQREGPVFGDQLDTFSSPTRVRRLFRRLSRRAQVPPANAYLLRNTWATQMLTGGAPLNYVSRALGHASSDLTMWMYQREDYGRQVEQASAEAMALLRHTLG